MVLCWHLADSPLRNCRRRQSPQLVAPAPQQGVRCSVSCSSPLLCELSILLYCMSVSRSRCVSPPSYPWTLELRSRRTQLAWNAPGLASPSSLVESGDQSDLKGLTPAFVAPLLYSSLRNVVNADLFFLLALQQACSEGIVNLHYPSCGAVWCLFTLVRPTEATSRPGGIGA